MNPRKLEIITKHGKKFAAKNPSAGVLEGVHYAADGSAVICDRYKLLRLRNVHSNTTAETRSLANGALIDGTYPDTSKLFPNLTANLRISGDGIKALAAVCKAVVDVAKGAGDRVPVLTIADGSLRYQNESADVEISATIAKVTESHPNVTLNPTFVFEALNVFRDAGARSVDVCITGTLSPIVFYDDETGIDVLVLPYKTKNER